MLSKVTKMSMHGLRPKCAGAVQLYGIHNATVGLYSVQRFAVSNIRLYIDVIDTKHVTNFPPPIVSGSGTNEQSYGEHTPYCL